MSSTNQMNSYGNGPTSLSKQTPNLPEMEFESLRIASDKCMTPPSPLDSPTTLLDSELSAIVLRMAREIQLKDRVYMLKEYKCCFKGTDAVRWMLANGVCQTVEEAVRFGNQLRERGFIRHVTNTHNFSNSNYYYWFHESIIETSSCSSLSSYKSMLGFRRTVAADDHDLGNELIQVQRTVHAVKADIETNLTRTREEIENMKERMKAFEKRLQREMEDQKWWLYVAASGLGSIFLIDGILKWSLWLQLIGIGILLPCYRFFKEFFEEDNRPKSESITEEYIHQKQIRDYDDSIVSTSTTVAEVRPQNTDDAIKEEELSAKDFDGWQDAPCMLIARPCLSHNFTRRLKINGEPFEFETEFFKGKAQFWVDGLASSPADIFKGKKRKSWFTVQGRFKKAFGFDQVVTGQRFDRPLKDLPSEFFLKPIFKVAKALNPSSTYQLAPYPAFLTNLIQTAQVVETAVPGTERPLEETSEDLRLMDRRFADETGGPLSPLGRKRLMHDQSLRSSLVYDTEHVWTFSFWQHLLDLSTFHLDVAFKRIRLVPYLDGQPLVLMAQDANGDLIWKFEIFHQDLLLS